MLIRFCQLLEAFALFKYEPYQPQSEDRPDNTEDPYVDCVVTDT